MSDVGRKVARALQLLDVVLNHAGGLPLVLGTRTGHDRIEEITGEDFWREDGSGHWS